MPIESLSLREVIIFLVAAGIVIPLVRKLNISPVLGYLTVGIVIGPHGVTRFGDSIPWIETLTVNSMEAVHTLGEMGIVFLLFMIGLELSFARLWSLRRTVFGLGGAQVLISGALIAFIASLFHNTLPAALILGAGFALSSTAIVMQLLTENRRLGTPTGQTSFSILLFQDLAVLPILFMVGAFGASTGGSVGLPLVLALAKAAAAIAIILVIGRLIIRPLFRLIGSGASREMFLALVLLVIIATGIASETAGLSMSLGAFLAGLLLAETEYRHEIEIDIEPFKGLLLGLFFMFIGMSIDLGQVAARPGWLFASVLGLFMIKGAVIYLLVRQFGERKPTALESALLLGQGGEFTFLVVSLGASLSLIPGSTAQFMLIVTGLTMYATPFVALAARRLTNLMDAEKLDYTGDEPEIPSDISGHVIVAGYGRVGQMIGSILDERGMPHVGLDYRPDLVGDFRNQGACVYVGNASRIDMLEKLGAETAAALVVTTDDPAVAERVVTTARAQWPNLAIYARAHNVKHASKLIELGATHVVPEATEASLQMGELILMGLGVPDSAARQYIESRRQSEQTSVDQSG
jgi:monovalent cation:proton antiporter-2 (CPA2) family protein